MRDDINILSAGEYFQVQFSMEGMKPGSYTRQYLWATNNDKPYKCLETLTFSKSLQDVSSHQSVHAATITDVRVISSMPRAQKKFASAFYKRDPPVALLDECRNTDLTIEIIGLGWMLNIQTLSVKQRNEWFKALSWLHREALRGYFGKDWIKK